MVYGMPDPALFPDAEIASAGVRVMQDQRLAATALQYGTIQGESALIMMLAEKLHQDEGLKIDPANILITTGSASAIGLAARALIDEGDVVLVEAPSFPGVMSIFRRVGGKMRTVPMDLDGLDIEGAKGVLQALHGQGIQPRVLYTMPTFHNPTGLTMPESRRAALLDLAARYDLLVIEDDAYRDLYYDAARGPLPPSLYALDGLGSVIRSGTFSKILAPGMRLGWALADPEIINRMMLLKEEGGTSPFSQHVAVEYGKDQVLASHVCVLVDAYRAKRDTMLAALQQHFPPQATWTQPSGGFFVWVTLPPSVDPAELANRARKEGVAYLPGEQCFAEPPATPATHMRLSFSLLSPNEIEEAIKRLGRIVHSLM